MLWLTPLALAQSPPSPLLQTDAVVATLDNGLTVVLEEARRTDVVACLLYTSPSPRDKSSSRMPSSA